jgi:hypothetical protein
MGNRTAALAFVSCLLFAQQSRSADPTKASAQPAPAKVDRALRERATEFLQDQVEGNFRKAFELVADDSKDFYFSIQKTKIESFRIDEVVYSDKFTRATVRSTVVRKTNVMGGPPIDIPSVVSDTWKLDRGKWMWYHDPKQDPVAPLLGLFGGAVGNQSAAKAGAELAGKGVLPKDTSPQAVAAAAAALTPRAALDRTSLTFVTGTEATEEISFHNGNRGQIKVSVYPEGTDAITVEPVSSFINALADLKVKVHYSGAEQRANGFLIFEVQPFGSQYRVPLNFVRPAAQSASGSAPVSSGASGAPASLNQSPSQSPAK